MDKIAIIGANGQLGTDLVKALGERAVPLTHQDLEICDSHQVNQVLRKLANSGIIGVVNCAAAHKVDEIEEDAKEAFEVNVLGVRNLALACSDLNIKLVQISTDYVFSGIKGPYSEADAPAPINVYGVSKLAGEHVIQLTCWDYLIIRTAFLFGAAGCRAKGGGNFVETIIRLGKETRKGPQVEMVSDIIVSPTFTKDLAEAIGKLIDLNERGLFHIVNAGCCTPYEFAEEILRLAGLRLKMIPVHSSDKDFAARPKNSALICSKLRMLGLELRPWEEALAAYLELKGYLNGLPKP